MAKMWNDPVMKALGKDYYEQARDPSTVVPSYDNILKHIPGVEYGAFDEDWEFKADQL